MIKNLLFFLCLTACGPDPNKWPYQIQVSPWNPKYVPAFQKHSDRIDELLGCEFNSISENKKSETIQLIDWKDLHEFGIAQPVLVDGSPLFWTSFWTGHGTNNELLLAVNNLPPEESESGILSECEAGYMYVWWLSYLICSASEKYNAMCPQLTDTSKITYSHPNCPGYIDDIDIEFVKELFDNHINVCD